MVIEKGTKLPYLQRDEIREPTKHTNEGWYRYKETMDRNTE